MKQISVRVSDEIHQKLKEKIVKEKTTVQSVMDKFIAIYLDEENMSIDDLLSATMKVYRESK